MNIALCSWESMHSIAVGGLAAHVSELAAALVRRGHELHIFTRLAQRQSRYEFIDGVHYHRCPFDPTADFVTYVGRMCDSFVWHLIETEAYLGRRFDLIHGHDWMAVPALARMKNEYHRPVIFTTHSTEFGRCGNSFPDNPMSQHARHLEWEGAYVADRVICVSKALSREIQWLYSVPADKVVTIYNGVDVSKYNGRVDGRKVRRGYEIAADDPFVLFAGRMAWQKGPDILLEAIPGLLVDFPRAKVVFAGDGDMRSGLESRAAHLFGSANSRFVGHKSGAALVELFKSADVVCVPSRNEPFGIVILEAWSARKPVVATRNGGPAEFIRDQKTGVTVAADVEGVQHGLLGLLADREGARRMGVNGRREVQARFTWDHAAQATEAVYAHALNPDARPSPSDGTPNDRVLRGLSNAITGTGPTYDEIRLRAHQIYLARKGAPGDPAADWAQAERELQTLAQYSVRRVAKSVIGTPARPITPEPLVVGP